MKPMIRGTRSGVLLQIMFVPELTEHADPSASSCLLLLRRYNYV